MLEKANAVKLLDGHSGRYYRVALEKPNITLDRLNGAAYNSPCQQQGYPLMKPNCWLTP